MGNEPKPGQLVNYLERALIFNQLEAHINLVDNLNIFLFNIFIKRTNMYNVNTQWS